MIELLAAIALGAANCGLGDEGSLTPDQIELAYEDRALAIVSAGKKPDLSSLSKWVDQNAAVQLQGHIYRDFVGAKGIVDFVTWFDADRYVIDRVRSAYLPPRAFICTPTKVSIEFLKSDRSEGMMVDFEFENGMLRKAKAFRKFHRVGDMPISVVRD